MYRLVLYGLFVISAVGIFFGFSGILDYSGFFLIISAAALLISCYISNLIFSKIFRVPVNSESAFITALILFLILSPAANFDEFSILALAGLLSMASKFLIAPLKKHIFNPAAFGAAAIFLLNIGGAIWWVANLPMLPIVSAVGLLVVRKIRRFDLFLSFLVAGLASIYYFNGIFAEALVSWPILFFGTIMLTEPLTTPPKVKWRIAYGILIGLLFGSQFNIWRIFPTPEIVLLLGNIFSYAVGFKRKIILEFKEKSLIAKDTYEFIFSPPKKLRFTPGEYLEWTLPHKNPDTRGVRRYFTIASSPTEKDIKIGIKIINPSSSFKTALSNLKKGSNIFAGQLDGDFILPQKKEIKIAFIAGGIGITPFRSMIRFLIDRGEKRDITIFYAVNNPEDIAYKDILSEAEKKIGLRTEYIVRQFISAELLKEKLPDWDERTFYISGPDPMVRSIKRILLNVGVARRKIVTDYFPGYA